MKKLFCVFIFASVSFQTLTADNASDKEALAIRKQINEVKNKKLKAEATKKDIIALQEDMQDSAVIDAKTLLAIEEANQLIHIVTDEDIASANISLLNAEISDGAKRATEIKSAMEHLNKANIKLDQIKNLLALKANKAQLAEKISELINKSKTENQSLIGMLEKELSGKVINLEEYSALSDKQANITKSIFPLDADVTNLIVNSIEMDEKEIFVKILNFMKDEDLLINSKNAEKKIDEKNLMNADIDQKKSIITLEKILNVLRPEGDLSNPSEKGNEIKTALTNLLVKINNQNVNIDKVTVSNVGNPNITNDPKYDKTVGDQREIKKDIIALSDKPGLDPEIKDKLKAALYSTKQGANNLDDGEPNKAIKSNDLALNAIQSAIDKADKNDQTANNKKNGKSDQNNKESKPNETKEFSPFVDSKFENTQASKAPISSTKVIIRGNKIKIGDEPNEKENWQPEISEKNKAVLFQSIVSKAPREYSEPTQKYFVAISDIGE